MGLKITRSIEVCNSVRNLIKNNGPYAETPIIKFEEYKQMCIEFGDIPIPPYHIQLKHPSHSDTIGRDKPMDRPRSARYEELHHIHFWQEGCVWEDDDGYQVQWNSTSDAFIIYSYFIDKDGDHHFYIIDILLDNAHNIIENNEQILKWVTIAKEFRFKNI